MGMRPWKKPNRKCRYGFKILDNCKCIEKDFKDVQMLIKEITKENTAMNIKRNAGRNHKKKERKGYLHFGTCLSES